MTKPYTDFLAELTWRGLLKDCTDPVTLHQHLARADLSVGGRRAYVGFDPTADSLTIGNLVGIIALKRWQDAGHTPVVVMGGGTGLIGDPSGKSAERQLRTREEVAANVIKQQKIFERILDFSPSRPNRAILVNNIDWLGNLSYLEALRDIGKHFSVNMMIQKDSVRERLHSREQGISYTEFSYMILQAYDFYHLFKEQNVTVQMGGSDQFGNIVVGSDLIRRLTSPDPSSYDQSRTTVSFGITWPLVTKADGTKFGKTESGAVWLTAKLSQTDDSPNRTSPYAFYQFWLNTADADVVRFLKTFTFLPQNEITRLEQSLAADPGKREAHRALAREVTRLVHGEDELAKAEAAAAALFSKKSDATEDIPFILPDDVIAGAPTTTHDKTLLQGVGISLIDLLPQTSLAKSKTEARTLLSQNSISVNGRKVALDARLTTATLLPASSPDLGIIAIRRGGKTWHITTWK